MERPAVREIPLNLHYYDQEVVQDVIENGFVDLINPVSGHTALHDGVLKFLISGTDAYVDLSKTYAIISVKLDGSMPGASSSAAAHTAALSSIGSTYLSVINNIGHSIFKSIKVRLANQTITKGDSDYAYKAYIQTLFNSSNDAQNNYFQICGWRKDTADKFNALTSNTTVSENGAAIIRRKFFNDAGEAQFIIRFHSAIFFNAKAMLPYIDIEIEAMRHPNPKFYLMHRNAGTFNLELTDAKLCVQKFKASPAYTAGIESMMRDKNEPVMFNLSDAIVNVYTITSGVQNYNNDTLFMGRVPKRIIIGFVDSTAYNGHSEKNPFYFQHFNVNYIRLLKNGLEYPQPALLIDFDSPNFIQAYQALMTSVQSDYNRDVLNLSMDEFKKGYFFYSVDMSPDQQGSLDISNVAHKPSQIKFECRFEEPLQSAIQLICYYEVDTQVMVDYKRNVVVNQL